MGNTTKSLILYNKIIELIKLYLELKKSKYAFEPTTKERRTPAEFEASLLKTEHELNVQIDALYLQSINDNFYFLDCPVKVYENTYNERLIQFSNSNIDGDEVNFLKEELENLVLPLRISEDNILTVHPKYFRLFSSYSRQMKFSYEKKKEFIRDKLFQFDWIATINPEHLIPIKIDNFLEPDQKVVFKKNEADLNTYSTNKTVSSKKHLQKSKDFHWIFKTKEAEQWFHDTIAELGAIDENNKPKRRFQVAANAIFENITCKKIIFKFNLSKVEYIAFLNIELQANIKDKYKLSQGIKYESKVENLIKIYHN